MQLYRRLMIFHGDKFSKATRSKHFSSLLIFPFSTIHLKPPPLEFQHCAASSHQGNSTIQWQRCSWHAAISGWMIAPSESHDVELSFTGQGIRSECPMRRHPFQRASPMSTAASFIDACKEILTRGCAGWFFNWLFFFALVTCVYLCVVLCYFGCFLVPC